ncbi:hypothetical protein [Corynebacterium haemomassiliense]|uniref:hypothetical protein n=1 Tax=Corynebacterium haemomassiliense TaxID=2754726 RepID=UPI00288C310F|nr:hypothetical protein [Corynebacterium haemomassiliense]
MGKTNELQTKTSQIAHGVHGDVIARRVLEGGVELICGPRRLWLDYVDDPDGLWLKRTYTREAEQVAGTAGQLAPGDVTNVMLAVARDAIAHANTSRARIDFPVKRVDGGGDGRIEQPVSVNIMRATFGIIHNWDFRALDIAALSDSYEGIPQWVPVIGGTTVEYTVEHGRNSVMDNAAKIQYVVSFAGIGFGYTMLINREKHNVGFAIEINNERLMDLGQGYHIAAVAPPLDDSSQADMLTVQLVLREVELRAQDIFDAVDSTTADAVLLEIATALSKYADDSKKWLEGVTEIYGEDGKMYASDLIEW